MSDAVLIQKNREAIESVYAAFNVGDFDRMLSLCDPKVTFQIPGKSKLAGKYDRTQFVSGVVGKLKELSGGKYSLEVHDILVSERHAVALGSVKFPQGGSNAEYRTAQVWRMESGKPVAWYEYPRDLYVYDAIWS